MLAPVFLIAGFINLLAKNLNFHINETSNPNRDLIRVKRDNYILEDIPLTPDTRENNDDTIKYTSEEEIPLLLNILKGEKRNDNSKSKRDTYKLTSYQNQPNTNGIYNNYNNNGNVYPYGYNGNNGMANMVVNNQNLVKPNQNNEINDRTDTNNIASHFKTKPNIFVRAFKAISSSLGFSKTTTPSPYRYSQNNGYYQNGFTNQQTGIDYTNNANQNTNKPYDPVNTYINNGGHQPNSHFTGQYNANDRPSYNHLPISQKTNNYNNGYQTDYRNGIALAPYTGNVYNSAPVPYNNIPYSTNNDGSNINNNIPVPFNYNSNITTQYNNGRNDNMNSANNDRVAGLPHRGNDNNKINGRGKETTTEININKGCILCGTFSCPDNKKRVGFMCQDANYDDDDY